jgi:ABC transporter DrrB family efflux protein
VIHDRLRRESRDIGVLTGRNIAHFRRQPQLLLFSTIQPIMFVLLFSFVFAGAIGDSLPEGTEYIDFLLPGIFVQSVSFRASQTAVGLGEDLRRGVIDRFRSMPMSRSAVLVGRTTADLIRNIFVIVLMAAVGYLVGFRFSQGPLEAVGSLAVVAWFSFALSWIFAFVALTVKNSEAAQSVGFIVLFPLIFASSIFVPLDTLPDWLQRIADVSPITYTANLSRALAIGGDVGDSLVGFLLWTFGLLLVFIPLCVWRYRRLT